MSWWVRWSLAAGATILLVLLLVPAAADWLVTKEGSRIETLGPWKVESRLVVFKRPDGTLASLRLSEVDLEASERLTREVKSRAEALPSSQPRRREIVARLTEKELPPVETPLDTPNGPATPQDESAEVAPEPQPLEIATWREIVNPAGAGLEFIGTIRNRSEDSAVGVALTAELFDTEGEVLATSSAILTSDALPPGQSSGFRVSFPGRFHYSRVEFRLAGRLLRTAPPDEDEGGGA